MEYTEEQKDTRNVSQDFGPYIKHLRHSKGLTLKEVAQVANVSASYISRLEKGERLAPSFPMLEALAKCYSIAVTELCKIALQEKDDFEESDSFEALLYSNQFTVAGKEADTQVKQQIAMLVSKVAQMDLDNEYQEIGAIMQNIKELKELLDREV